MSPPPGWSSTRVDRVATVKARIGWKALTASEYQEDGYAFLSTPNIKTATIDFNDVNYISQYRYDESPELKLQVGDVLLAKDGSTLGIANVVRDLPRPATVNGSIAILRPFGVDPRLLMYTLQGAAIQEQIRLLRAGMGVPHLFQWDINRLPLTLPPLDVQRRVADFLDDQVTRIDNIIQARQEQSALFEESHRSAMITTLLQGGSLNGQDETFWFADVPTDLPLRPLRTVWEVIDCKHRTPHYVDDGYPVVSPGDISPGPLNLNECSRFVGESDYLDLADDLRRCRVGDIVYSRNASAGTAALVETSAPFTMGQDVCRITSRWPDQRYLYYALNYLVEPQLDAVRIGSTFTRINVDRIKALLIPVPSWQNQTRISTAADSLSNEHSRLRRDVNDQVVALRELKRSLISAAVSGEFDVSTADGSGVAL